MPKRHKTTPLLYVVSAIFVAAAVAACARQALPGTGVETLTITLVADGASSTLVLPEGTFVREVLARQGIHLGELDRVTPSDSSLLADGALVRVVRVAERFEIEQTVMAFERQTVRNDALGAGEVRLIQPGVNGSQETTFRIMLEDGREVSRSPVKSVVTANPVPEIVMIGSRAALAAIPIGGTLAYISAGNAWIMQGSSSARHPLTVTGDLDGRAFALSPDARWLLFTAAAGDTTGGEINQLRAVSTGQTGPRLVDLKIPNIVHFAEWSPSSRRTFAYSTAEPRPAFPGWQANNDLILSAMDESGRVTRKTTVLGPSAGGAFGTWGTRFAWSPDGTSLAYARADSLGLVTLATKKETLLRQVTPFQAFGDWLWIPWLAWAPGGQYLYTVHHGEPMGLESLETSPIFDVVALALSEPGLIRLSPQAGIFALPTPSPANSTASGERAYQIAYLQAIEPAASSESRYRLWVMDRDGSNARPVFPPEGEPGLEIEGQRLAWSPDAEQIALIYRGNLWLVDLPTDQAQQLTGDGQASEPRWVK